MPASSRSRSARHAVDVSLRCGHAGRAESGDGGDILGARAQPALLAAAFDQRLGDMNVTAADERASALRTAELVRGDTDRDRRQARAILQSMRPAPCTASTCSTPFAACTISAICAIGWITPVSLLASMTDTSGRSAFLTACCECGKIDDAVASDRQLLDVVGSEAAAAAHGRMLDCRHEQTDRAAPCGRQSQVPALAPACWLRSRRW